MDRQHRATGDFGNVGTGVDHDSDHRCGEGVDANIREGHRQGEVDIHHLHYDRRTADHFNEYEGNVVSNPAAVGAGQTRQQTDNNTARQAEDRNPQSHFGAVQQNWNGWPDDAPVKLHDVFLYTVVENKKTSQRVLTKIVGPVSASATGRYRT